MTPVRRRLDLFYKFVVSLLLPCLLLVTALGILYLNNPGVSFSITSLALLALTVPGIAGAFIYFKRIAAEFSQVSKSISQLSAGSYPAPIKISGTHEISLAAQHINVLAGNLKAKEEFTTRIRSGDLEASYATLNGHDTLGDALLGIKENLIRIKSEEQQRSWTTEALGKFVELLRTNKSLKELANDIIINIVKTLRANQGAIFIAAKDGQGAEYLNMEACYAYQRTKYLTKRIDIGEGLVGQAYLEKETIYLKEIPEHFVRITSGLGDAPPTNLLIIPLKMNEDIAGILELASFQPFERYEIEFAEKISENIAHTIHSFRTNENTKALLRESQERTEQMRAQEEELRQNQEELQATQEEISRKYNVLFSQLHALNLDSKFDQLFSITFTRKRNIEYYFDIIRNQIITFSEDKMIRDALRAFSSAFRKIDAGISSEQLAFMKQDVEKYYREEFIPRLNDNTGQTRTASDYFPEGAKANILQFLYLSENPHPTGKKSLLDDAGDGSEYSRAHAIYHPVIRSYLEKFGYYDIFLLDGHTGELVYSVFKEVDYATSLVTGLYSKTNFGNVVQQAIQTADRDFVKLIDFEMYDPSYGAPASFIAKPIFEDGEKTGIVVFQMPINKVNQILTGDNHWREDGLGSTGETFLVGGDYRLRSITRGLIEKPEAYSASLQRAGYGEDIIRQIAKTGTNILLQEVRLKSVSDALASHTGKQVEKDPFGVESLYTYAPLAIPDVHWVILSTVTKEEAVERIEKLRGG